MDTSKTKGEYCTEGMDKIVSEEGKMRRSVDEWK